jgi:hypothetical protein
MKIIFAIPTATVSTFPDNDFRGRYEQARTPVSSTVSDHSGKQYDKLLSLTIVSNLLKGLL